MTMREIVILGVLLAALPAFAGTLYVGAASISITPDAPIALRGQMHTRIGRTVESAIEANALAIETREENETIEQSIFISCDLVAIPEDIATRTRDALKARLPDFDVQKLVLSATHTHTSAVMTEGKYTILDEDVMRPEAYSDFLVPHLVDVAAEAWGLRQKARIGWGMDYAVVGYNRRSYFADGHAQMYGNLAVDDFRGIEGPEDHAVESLFFWDEHDRLIATAINLTCPAQEVEGRSAVNADFWHPVRETLKEKHGRDFVVLGWIGAAGDQSPHIRYRQAAEDRMRRLRGLGRLEEIARRIVGAWESTYEYAQLEKFDEIPFTHVVEKIELPRRLVTDQEYKDIQAETAAASTDPKHSARVRWHESVLARYEQQQNGDVSPYEMRLHAIRLGDIAIATNDFELFTQYGIQMKAKCKAIHTFIIQLAGPGSYIPTPIAASGGGYSAVVQSNVVGPEGGQALVDKTVAALNALWHSN